MKKILIEASSLAQSHKTGVGYFAEHLAEAIQDVDPDNIKVQYVWLNFLGKRMPSSRLLNDALESGDLFQIKHTAQRLYAKLVYYGAAYPLRVASSDWILFPNFYLWPTLGVKKKAVIIHDMCFLRHPEYVEDKNQRFLNKVAVNAIKKADLVIANSLFTTSEIVDLTGVSSDKICTIDIPINNDEFKIENNKGPTYLQHRYGINKKYILTLGTIEPRKNIPLLVDAYCLLPKRLRSKYSLVIAGKWGWKTNDVRKLIYDKKEQGFDIVLTDYIDDGDKNTLYRNASVYGISTFYEGFGMPLLEALYCQLPTVATDIPVLREVAGENSCLWSSFNPKDYADKLQLALTDHEVSKNLQIQAEIVTNNYSWHKTAKKVIEAMN